jgi:holo-[acyl-carrier protein] synthase
VTATVLGIGIDLVDIAELGQSVLDRPRMVARVFTRKELAYCRALPRADEHLAARFAAKEAAFKAIGTGWGQGVTWRDAEVVSTRGAAPALVLRGALGRRAKEIGARTFHLSLTHSGNYAAAVVVVTSL